jgi:hypothetical protein
MILSRDVIWINKTYSEHETQMVGLEQYYNDDDEEKDIMPMRIPPTLVNAPVIAPPPPRWVERLQDELTQVYEHRTRSGRSHALIHQRDPDTYCCVATDGETNTYNGAIQSANSKFWL